MTSNSSLATNNTNNRIRNFRKQIIGTCSTAALALTTCCLAAPAQAQNQAQNATAPIEQVVVTGSRITLSGFTAPTPVTVLNASSLQQFGSADASGVINQVPSFRADRTTATWGNGSAPPSNIGSQTIDLRGLGETRTLVLVDGKRFVPSDAYGTVDINFIPALLIQRTEVVTGGASAAYGSDAVAGVVNFILNRQLTGLKGQVQYGQSQYGDDRSYEASIAGGTDFMGGRGHIVGAFEYSNNAGVGTCYSRPFCRVLWTNLANPLHGTGPGTNGMAAKILGYPIELASETASGIINAPSQLKGIAFMPDGSQYQFNYGELPGTFWMLGGGGPGHESDPNPYYNNVLFDTPVQRSIFFGHANYDFGGGIEGDLDVSLGRVIGRSRGLPPAIFNQHISVDNPYIPANILAIMQANNLNSFTLGRFAYDFGITHLTGTSTTGRVVASLKGSFNDNWQWNAYYEYGHNYYHQTDANNYQRGRWNDAVDAVRGPGGQIVCRIALTNPGTACQPIDLFGQNMWTPGAKDWVFGTSWEQVHTVQHVAEANVQGKLFAVQGGEVAIAAGVDYRRDSINTKADPTSQVFGWNAGNFSNSNGSVSVYEGYLETDVPLLKNVPLAHTLDLNGAVRVTDYSTSGTVDTWKLGFVYEPTDYLRLRFTRSRDIRAPNVNELYGSTSQGTSRVFDYALARDFLTTTLTGGNSNLNPEIGDTWTTGMVLTPKWGFTRRMSFSVDYFHITINQAIEQIGAQQIDNRCTQGAAEMCALITRDSTGAPILIRNPWLNVAQMYTDGIDFEGDYRQPTDFGTFDFRLLATYVDHLKITDSAGSTDRAGQTGLTTGAIPGQPHWIAVGTLTYNNGPVQMSLQGRYVGAGHYDNTLIGPDLPHYDPNSPFSISNNLVSSRLYFNLGAHYDFEPTENSQIEAYIAIHNLLNTTPPVVVNGGAGDNPILFDGIGRRFTVGLRFLD